jgi:hypothetical protein
MLAGGPILNAQVKLIELSVDQTGIEQCFKTVIEEPLDEKLLLYPNPNDGTFTLKVAPSFAAQIISIEVIDKAGRIIHTEDVPDPTSLKDMRICLKDLETGIYLLKVHAGKEFHTRKFVIQNQKR